MYKIYICWPDYDPITENRQRCINDLRRITECEVILVTPDNLDDYILPSEPLHPAYKYLSATHKADYLRTYFMNFHGGGYTDIKSPSGSWRGCFDELYKSDKWINGHKEWEIGGVAPEELTSHWRELVGNCAYICKPQTPLTKEWYGNMMKLLDEKLERLMVYPATHSRDCADVSEGKYPIGWNEMLGRIFHRVCFRYRDKLLINLPEPIYTQYR